MMPGVFLLFFLELELLELQGVDFFLAVFFFFVLHGFFAFGFLSQ